MTKCTPNGQAIKVGDIVMVMNSDGIDQILQVIKGGTPYIYGLLNLKTGTIQNLTFSESLANVNDYLQGLHQVYKVIDNDRLNFVLRCMLAGAELDSKGNVVYPNATTTSTTTRRLMPKYDGVTQ